MLDLRDKKIVITGGAGFLGQAVFSRLQKENCKKIFTPRFKEYDLRNKSVCAKVVQGQDIVVHLAAHVGGIGLNKEHPGQLFYDNAIMGIELMEAARRAKVKKMVIVGTACSYPKYCPVPFKETDFWTGAPDEITGVYGLAKKMLLVQSQAYRKEYGFNSIYLIPVNLYGPRDHFDPEFGHVIPSLITRMVLAKEKKQSQFLVWGSGTATREFIYVDDAARGIVSALKKYDDSKPVNLGTGSEISIRDLVELLKYSIGYSGEIVWDETKPDGQPRRCVDIEMAQKLFEYKAKISLKIGLKKTVEWYLEQNKH